MSVPLVVIGGGGFGREVLDVVEAINQHSPQAGFDVLGVLDDRPSTVSLQRLSDRNHAYLGTLSDWLLNGRSALFVVAIGDPSVRSRVCYRLKTSSQMQPAVLIHPNAVVGSRARLGEGTVVCAGAQISTNVAIGNHVHINPGAIIGHDAQLAAYVSINPGAIISGETVIEESSLIGAGSVVLQGLTIGRGSTVGAGAVVTRDVGNEHIVKGVPAR